MIVTVTLNPALDKSILVDRIRVGDTNRIIQVETDAGGKGINVSRVLKALGSETVAMGFVGGTTGRFIEHVLNQEGVPTDFVRVAGETRTNLDIQEQSGAPPTALNECGPTIRAEELDELRAKLRKVLIGAKMVVLGGSLPPGVPPGIYAELIQLARERGVRAVLDADGESLKLGLAAKPFMIKPNAAEAARLLGQEVASPEDAVEAAKVLVGRGIGLVVISMGSKGAVAVTAEESWLAAPPEVKAISTIGSGDSMIAGITHTLGEQGSLAEALRWGSAAGAATAMTSGKEIASRAGIVALLDQVRLSQPA